jgi:hypothetical protein
MVAAEHFQRFARWAHATVLHVFHALAHAFERIRLRGHIQQALRVFVTLHDYFGLSFNGLEVFISIEHEGLAG